MQAERTGELLQQADQVLDQLLELWPIVQRADELRELLAGLMLSAGVHELEAPGRGKVTLDSLAKARVTWTGPNVLGLILDITRLSGTDSTRVRWP